MRCKPAIGFLILFLPTLLHSGERSTDARELIRRVSRSYQDLQSYYFEGLLRTEIKGEGFYQRIELPVVVSAVKPDKTRIEIKHSLEGFLIVTDGDTTWEYVPRLKQFTRQTGDVSRVAGYGSKLSLVAMSLVEDYSRLGRSAVEVRLVGEETREIDSREVRCLLVEYAGRTPLRFIDDSGPSSILSIDPERNLILQEDSRAAIGSSPFGWPAEARHTITLTKARINQSLPDSLFVFTPPQGAQQVQVLGSRSAPTGREAKDFTLEDLNGRPVRLSGLRGKVVILEFWASWCEPCRYEMPLVEALQHRFRDEGLVVLGINDEDPPIARRYVEQGGYTFPTLFDKGQTVAGLYGVRAIPALFVIDRQGEIVGRHSGYGPGSEEKILDSLRKAGME